jgi:hypothetical protein
MAERAGKQEVYAAPDVPGATLPGAKFFVERAPNGVPRHVAPSRRGYHLGHVTNTKAEAVGLNVKKPRHDVRGVAQSRGRLDAVRETPDSRRAKLSISPTSAPLAGSDPD